MLKPFLLLFCIVLLFSNCKTISVNQEVQNTTQLCEVCDFGAIYN